MAEPLGSLGLMPNQEVVEDVVVIVNNQANQDGTSICTETNAGIAGDSIDVVSDVVNNVVVRTECVPHEVEITSEDLGHLSKIRTLKRNIHVHFLRPALGLSRAAQRRRLSREPFNWLKCIVGRSPKR